jgi:hypothetical protein
LGFDQFAEQKELVLKRFGGFVGAEKALVNRRECGRSGGAEDCAVHRNFAPTATMNIAKAGKFLYSGPCFIHLTRREERHPYSEFCGKAKALLSRASAEKLFRNGKQQTGPVAAGSVGVDSAAMSEANEGGKRALDNVARAEAPQLSDESHTAGVVVRVAVKARISHDPLQPLTYPEVQS